VGIRLFVEVLDSAPTTLTHREKLVLAVLAEDAPDETRVTWNSVESPLILRRGKVTRPQMYEVLKALIAKGVLKRVSAGQKNASAKYMILSLTAQCPEIPDADATPQCPESADTDAPQRPATPDAEGEVQGQEIPDTDESQCPETPDVSVRESRTPTPLPPRDIDLPLDRFDEFWAAYPRKTSKGYARKAWDKAIKKHADPAAIIAAVPRHAAYWRAIDRKPEFIPHPSTWLNGTSWDDELPAVTARPGGPAPYRPPTF
jgi:hypothetical protein